MADLVAIVGFVLAINGLYFLDHPQVMVVAGLILLLFVVATRFNRRRRHSGDQKH